MGREKILRLNIGFLIKSGRFWIGGERALGVRRGNFKGMGAILRRIFSIEEEGKRILRGRRLCREEGLEPIVKREGIEELGRERNEGSLEK